MENLVKALVKAKKEFKPVEFNKTVNITTKAGKTIKFSYADLKCLMDATTIPLLNNGLVMIQQLESRVLTTILAHESGEMLKSSVTLSLEYNDLKDAGSAITYMKRYSYAAILGLVADEDRDAEVEDKIEHVKQKASQATVSKVETQDQSEGFITMPIGKHQGKKLAELPKDYVKYILTDPKSTLDKVKNKKLVECLEEVFPEFKSEDENILF